jgi:hypothetical protein
MGAGAGVGAGAGATISAATIGSTAVASSKSAAGVTDVRQSGALRRSALCGPKMYSAKPLLSARKISKLILPRR